MNGILKGTIRSQRPHPTRQPRVIRSVRTQTESPDLLDWAISRDWTNALTPPTDMLEFDLSPSNGFSKVEAEIK